MKCRKAVAAVLLSSAVIISGCSGSGLTKETEESVNNDFSRTDIKAIKAQDDFYGYVNQETLNGIEIGPEMPVAGPFYDTGVEDALMAKIGEIVNSNEEYEEGLGPLIFSYNTYGSLPSTYGMLLKRICTFDSNTDSAYFTFATDSGLTKSGMKVYLYIK